MLNEQLEISYKDREQVVKILRQINPSGEVDKSVADNIEQPPSIDGDLDGSQYSEDRSELDTAAGHLKRNKRGVKPNKNKAIVKPFSGSKDDKSCCNDECYIF